MSLTVASTRRPFARLRVVEGRVLLGESWLEPDERVELALPDSRALVCRLGPVRGGQLVARAELLGDDHAIGRPEIQFQVPLGAFARRVRR